VVNTWTARIQRGLHGSIAYQMTAARFPPHRDLKGFDLSAARVDEALIRELNELGFSRARTTWCSSVDPAQARPITTAGVPNK
jgi:hypothetical protein